MRSLTILSHAEITQSAESFSPRTLRTPRDKSRVVPRSLRAPREASRGSLRCAGFTLMELLTVIAIIGVLMGLIIGAAKYAQTKGAVSRAQTEIAYMEAALEHYKGDNGVYPTTPSAYPPSKLAPVYGNSATLYTKLTTPKTYMTFKANQLVTVGGVTYIVDPFGGPYNYYNSPGSADQMNQATFDLWSYGPSGTNGAPDMITNWKQ
jgi:general secretion pathway protein G